MRCTIVLKSVAAVLRAFVPAILHLPRGTSRDASSVDASFSPQIASWRALIATPLQVTSESDARGMSDMKLGHETC
jgi:hypothetical protein